MSSITADKIYASLPTTVRGEKVNLKGDPKGVNFMYGRTKHLTVRNMAVSNTKMMISKTPFFVAFFLLILFHPVPAPAPNPATTIIFAFSLFRST